MAISAILTADIVNSTLFSPAEEKRFRSRLDTILKPFRFEFYRGDSFQVFIREPEEALQTVLAIRAEVRKMSIQYDVRCSIGLGEVNSRINKLSTATDAAFVRSGRSFDNLSNTGQRLAIFSGQETADRGLAVISYFIDYLVQRWTEKQAEVIGELLQDNTQTKAARKLRKSLSTINKHAQAAGWNEIQKLLEEYHQIISILLHGNYLVD